MTNGNKDSVRRSRSAFGIGIIEGMYKISSGARLNCVLPQAFYRNKWGGKKRTAPEGAVLEFTTDTPVHKTEAPGKFC